MKILFVDSSADLQQKWIEPLREMGWGAVRARSHEDAERMMALHGESLQAIVVGEKFVSFAERHDLIFVVLTQQWKDREILAHQNSDHSAIGYIPYASSATELYKIFDSGTRAKAVPLKATGTDGSSLHEISLEDHSGILSKPEATKTNTLGLQLENSSVVLGGQVFSQPRPEVESIELSTSAPEPIAVENGTLILDSTQLSVDFASQTLEEPQIDFSPEDLNVNEISSLDDLISEGLNVSSPEPVFSSPHQFSVNPNPAMQVSDVETLKSYLALREQDVAVLSGQVRSSHERIQQLELLLKVERAKGAELTHLVSKQEQAIKHYDQEKQVELEVLGKQIDDMSAQLKERTDKFRAVEAKLRLTSDEINKVKDRVRVDIRRIRVREKELENQLEVLKKDSSALIQARDEKVLELKRKIDLLEFNMELVQEQYSKERKTADELRTRLKDAASVMKQAGGMLEQ